MNKNTMEKIFLRLVNKQTLTGISCPVSGNISTFSQNDKICFGLLSTFTTTTRSEW